MTKISIEIFCSKSTSKSLLTIDDVDLNDNVLSLKKKIALAKRNLGVERISLRLEPRGKSLRDEEIITKLNIPLQNAQLYLKDLGPQIAWKTVFMFEYAGPLFIYPIFYFRPWLIYGGDFIFIFIKYFR